MSQFGSGGGNFYNNNGGGGGGFETSPFGSPSRQKSDVAQSLRPFTIGQLQQATQLHSDAEWRVEGQEVGQVTVVGQVVSIQRQPTNHVFQLDDGTGLIEARRWIASTDEDGTPKDEIAEQRYIRVTGGLKSFGKKRYVNITSIRPISNSHEIYFHLLETMTVYLTLTRGSPHKGADGPVVKGEGGSSIANYSSQNAAAMEQFSNLPAFKRSIVQYILSQATREEGIHVGVIARAIGSSEADANQISQALDELMDEGIVFTTIDDSHFNVST
ncbi:hypothetical protein CPB83DRAFT_1641 [Crepidotus variabilis]|uniref:Replication protein A 32 kDa subunit n=1 Tax=Crepidotus variabilis TaxID=179855 RepID=A0A9P6JWP8_9AGAR|nr:hypothetical protein CPB83DRAFT_1641 [Crepidotus variabilis]